MNNVYGFSERLAFSQGVVAETCEATLISMIPGSVSVEKTDTETDKTGIDYVVTLRRGATINVDHKARDAGCSAYWDNGPELALELWSVKPCERVPQGITGWTLDEAKATDYTLHTFDAADTDAAYLLPFHLLRKAYRENFGAWNREYKRATQQSFGWQSECVFVPAAEVTSAIMRAMKGVAA